MGNNRNDLAIRQQFTVDFRMTPNTFMDTFSLVRNRLEKQDTRFREAFPIEKTVAIAFKSSHQRCSMKKVYLEISQNITGKHLCRGLFFQYNWRSETCNFIKKRDSGIGVFLYIF